MGICLECKKPIPPHAEVDLQLCQECMALFDTDKLWKQHDNNEIDALDFNESSKIREKYRLEILTEKPFDAKKIALELIAEYNITKEDFKDASWYRDDGDTIYETVTGFFDVRGKVEKVIQAMEKVLTE